MNDLSENANYQLFRYCQVEFEEETNTLYFVMMGYKFSIVTYFTP